MYTTPVQSGQYKLNSVLSLAGMKVRNISFFLTSDVSHVDLFLIFESMHFLLQLRFICLLPYVMLPLIASPINVPVVHY